MYYFISTGIIITALVLWIIALQRRLMVLEANVGNAVSQIGIQLSSQWDALEVLVSLAEEYMGPEEKAVMETIKERHPITKVSSTEDIARQHKITWEITEKITAMGRKHPELMKSQDYTKTLDGVRQYESMVQTSSLIYNESAAKLNKALKMFPNSLVAGILGFDRRTYLDTGR
jgi:LemA protein